MRASKWGRVINIASVHGLVGSADKSAYLSAKQGSWGLTKVAGLETAKTGVTSMHLPGFCADPAGARANPRPPPRGRSVSRRCQGCACSVKGSHPAASSCLRKSGTRLYFPPPCPKPV
ncbi:SDR family NAD(P)-dependent oxidoreductase [Cupriavidus taiwanensis]|uniref:SDR family NAD(P)-dependent oxidoreductase n=1 Tax=Cupriavidus taiwanensis TaxID=164546 RepID=UPI0021621207|nr:SDR family NAD(P)-dependent oxidoreductase [Cupriavidus taiwanensis]